jgi:hypothetical protein
MTGGPLAGVTGGFIPQLCPPPTAAQAAALAAAKPGSAAAAAAAIQASEADAKARVAAVEYLGTVDCSRWPEAQKALINALREDPNECVRFAAARVLNNGCCCDKKVIEALRICVAGETTDNAPAENSPRVKAAAFSALQNCLMRVPEDIPPETTPVEPERSVPGPGPAPALPERTTQTAGENPHIATAYAAAPRRRPPSFDDQLQRKTFAQTVDGARRTLFDISRTPRPAAALPTGKRSLFNALSKARQDANATNLRHARAQGLVPPQPAPADPGVEPSSYSPAAAPVPASAAAPAPGGAILAPDHALVPEAAGADPSLEPGSEPTPPARRGLLGLLLPSRDR